MTDNDRTGLWRRYIKSQRVRGQLNMIVINHHGDALSIALHRTRGSFV
jgi:hypothetical protein